MPDPRRIILKILLGSLAIAAVAGVAAVLATSDVILRVTATGFATAGAALLMLPLSMMIDRQRFRPAGLLGTGAVVLEFVLLLILIWEWDATGRLEERLELTAGIVPPTAGAAIILLVMLPRPTTAVAAKAGLASTAAFFVLAMIGTWSWTGGSRWETRERWWSTAAIVAWFGLMAVAALAGFVPGDRRFWRWAGVASCAIGAVLALADAWHLGWGRADDPETVSLFVAAAAYVGFANLITRAALGPWGSRLRSATLAAAAATAVLSELLVFDVDLEPVRRLDAAAAILTGCGTLAVGILARLQRRVDFEIAPSEIRTITLFCPRCRRKQTIELGGASCRTCGLRIEVRAEEPRCRRCGYLLVRLTSGACPECGTSIEAPEQPSS